MIPVPYDGDDARAERILLETARKHTMPIAEMSGEAREHLKRIYNLQPPSVEPRVYYHMTDNWIELTVRFLVPDRGIREIKDAMYRDIRRSFREAGIDVASGTYDIVGLPPIRIKDGLPEAERTE
jgi:small-conductance mechanosensitive channel